MLRPIIAGVAALIVFIASATTSALVSAQEVQAPSFANHLAENVTNVLCIQEDLDRGLEQKTDTLYDIVQITGDEVQGLKVRSQMYNESQQNWTRVKRHLHGIWHNTNTSLDLLAPHKEAVSLRNAKPLAFEAASTANDILKKLQAIFLSWSLYTSLLLGIAGLGFMILFMACLLPVLLREITSAFTDVKAELHKFKLQCLP